MIYAHTRKTPRPMWKRVQHIWHLSVGGVTVARIVHHPEGYLSHINRPDANGWDCAHFASLAQAKACLLRWWATHATERAFARFYRTAASD